MTLNSSPAREFIRNMESGLSKCKRIMQILNLRQSKNGFISLRAVKLAIYEAIGVDRRTVEKYIRILVKDLKWLIRLNYQRFKISPNYFTEDF